MTQDFPRMKSISGKNLQNNDRNDRVMDVWEARENKFVDSVVETIMMTQKNRAWKFIKLFGTHRQAAFIN
jgi:hypothetical protein